MSVFSPGLIVVCNRSTCEDFSFEGQEDFFVVNPLHFCKDVTKSGLEPHALALEVPD